jgi:threonine/homoserine/homoserine lactone efflux protein
VGAEGPRIPDLHTFVIFGAAGAVFLAVPGPSVIYIVSRSLAEGRTAGIVRGWLGERRRALARTSGCAYVGLGVLAALSPGSSSSAHELMQ